MQHINGLPEHETYLEELDFAVSVALCPLKSFIEMLYQQDDEAGQIDILDDLFRHAEKKIQKKFDALHDQVGVIRLRCASYHNSQQIPPETLLRVEFDKR